MHAEGRLFDVQGYALYDGPGIRTCVFLSGCPLRCRWCHNPECFFPDRGRPMSVGHLVDRVLEDKEFYDHSGGGVTLTGGEPTVQARFLLAFLANLRALGIHTTLETCGDFPPDLLAGLIEQVDLFLFDLKHMTDARHREGTGRGNGRILGNFEVLLASIGAGRIIPRIPLVPGYNTDMPSIEAFSWYLDSCNYQGEVHLMPAHNMAMDKYRDLGLSERFECLDEWTQVDLDRVRNHFEDRGFPAIVNGG